MNTPRTHARQHAPRQAERRQQATVSLTAPVMDALRARAEAEDRSLSAVVNRILERDLIGERDLDEVAGG